MMRQALARGLRPLLALALIASILAPTPGCGGGGTTGGQAVTVPPEVEKQNQDRGEQIRKDMEAKFKKGGRP